MEVPHNHSDPREVSFVILFRNYQARAFGFKLLLEASIYITVGNNVPNFIE